MAAFEYIALDTRGKQKKGVLEGDTPRSVRQTLREQSLTPMSVTQVQSKSLDTNNKQRAFTVRRSLSSAELALVTRQLATLVQAGLPLEEALQAIGEQSEQPRTKSIVLGVRAKVREGYSLASSLAEFPQAFPAMFRATIDAGEQSGKLDGVLDRLADYTENRQNLSQKAKSALIYPTMLIILSLCVVAFMLSYVVPKIVSVVSSAGGELPALTKALIASSEFIRSWWWLLIIGAVALFLGIRWLLSKPGPKKSWHQTILQMPVFGRLARGLNTARFMRTLSILASSGVPVLDSLKIAGEVVGNVPMREGIDIAANKIREGAPISRSFKEQQVFPPMTIHLISSGEASGELDNMLERAAVNQEREMNGLIDGLMSIVEPLIIVFMGVVVLVIVMAILLPIFNMNT
ncbi:MAG: type II secretion system inner membrane protein GspF, partial [Woeseiaceae bacterium]